MLLAGLALVSTGCRPQVNLGPVVKDRIVVVETTTKTGRKIEMATILSSHKVDVVFKQDDKVFTQRKQIKGWVVVRPDVARAEGLVAPRVGVSVVATIKTADGKQHQQDIGGWYLVKAKSVMGE